MDQYDGQHNRYSPQILGGNLQRIAVKVLAEQRTKECYSYTKRFNSKRTNELPQPITVAVLNFGRMNEPLL